MVTAPAILGVHLLDPTRPPVRIGSMMRDAAGEVAFTVAEAYLRTAHRPIFSLAWFDPASDAESRIKLARRDDKIGLGGAVPSWFAGLLPEGALHARVFAEMGPGAHDPFDMLTRLGGDLPGGVLVAPDTAPSSSAGPLDLIPVQGFQVAGPRGTIRFSLAGARPKFTARADDAGLIVPGRGESGDCLVKTATPGDPGLLEAEYAGMALARLVGVDTARCRLVPRAAVQGLSDATLAHGESVLAVDRFDRGAGGARIHSENAAQILGATADRPLLMATTETVLNMVGRFSTDRRADILEAVRRIVADVLIGNGGNHLKSWSFRFAEPGRVRLSPAYGIVPTILFRPDDGPALRFVGADRFETVDLPRFARVADFLRVDQKWVVREVRQTVERALDRWPAALPALLDDTKAAILLARLERLTLVREVRGKVVC